MIRIRTIEELPKALLEARRRQCLTQAQMADKCDVTQQTISAIENGKLEPNFRLLIRIQKALMDPIKLGASE